MIAPLIAPLRSSRPRSAGRLVNRSRRSRSCGAAARRRVKQKRHRLPVALLIVVTIINHLVVQTSGSGPRPYPVFRLSRLPMRSLSAVCRRPRTSASQSPAYTCPSAFEIILRLFCFQVNQLTCGAAARPATEAGGWDVMCTPS
jgi:hypothetical protein